MTNLRLIMGLAAAWLLLSASPSAAQFYGYGGYGYGGWGGGAVATRQAWAQDRQVGQQAAMGQNMVVQSGIRSTTMGQAQQRSSEILGQRQADKDWWFQHQQQQVAQRQAGGGAPMMGGGFGGAPAAAGLSLTASQPEVAMDIIKWPTALQERPFSASRAQIEAPYRRSPPKLSVPTADDYRDMTKAVQEMKSILEWCLTQSGGVDTKDYNEAKAFLDKLGQETSAKAGGATPR